MRVLFIKKNNRKNKNAPAVIYCRVKLNGEAANDFSTNVKVDQAEWDSTKQRVKGKSQEAHDNNLILSGIRSDITHHFLQAQSLNESIGAQRLADLYTGKQKKHYLFSELVDLFEQHVQATYRNKGTRRNYKTRIDNIRLFLEEKGLKKLPADRFTLGSADEFVRWAKAKNHERNYIVRHTQVLKNITEDAVRREILPVDKLAAFVLKKKEKYNTDHLTRSELERLATFDWRPEMRRIVDLFLFSVYTGLHYEDAQTLAESDMRQGIDGRLWLFKARGKYAESEFFVNESIQRVPLSAPALALIEQYGGVDKLPKISNAKYNDWLKQIKHMAGIQVKLTVRVARKTFTDVMLNEMMVSEESVAAMLGHNTTKHVKHYGRAGEERVAKEVIFK